VWWARKVIQSYGILLQNFGSKKCKCLKYKGGDRITWIIREKKRNAGLPVGQTRPSSGKNNFFFFFFGGGLTHIPNATYQLVTIKVGFYVSLSFARISLCDFRFSEHYGYYLKKKRKWKHCESINGNVIVLICIIAPNKNNKRRERKVINYVFFFQGMRERERRTTH
jgi:hypothetical protein